MHIRLSGKTQRYLQLTVKQKNKHGSGHVGLLILTGKVGFIFSQNNCQDFSDTKWGTAMDMFTNRQHSRRGCVSEQEQIGYSNSQ